MNRQTELKTKGMMSFPLHETSIRYWSADGEPCFNFSEEHKNNHWPLWEAINKYLKSRGFKVTADPRIQKHHRSLSPNHRYGKKGHLEFFAERSPRSLNYEFFQSLVFENQNGGRYDFQKYKKMPYMVKLSYRNEALRLAEFVKSLGVRIEIIHPKTAIEKIIESNNENLHVHGAKISCLEDLKPLVDAQPHRRQEDRDKKIIACGDSKCFYHWDRSLKRGTVWHNINNMWWVLVNGDLHNIASFNLFDHQPGTPKRSPLTADQQLQRIHTELKDAEAKQNYEKCIVLKKLLGKEKLYNVWSPKHNLWWGGNNSGYTADRNHAGVYRESSVLANLDYYNNGTGGIIKPIIAHA